MWKVETRVLAEMVSQDTDINETLHMMKTIKLQAWQIKK